jgi:hypothetical protein
MARNRRNAGSAFGDAFSSTFDAVKGVRQGLRSRDIMNEEVIEGEDGKSWSYGGKTYDHAVKGDELRGLQYDQMETMYNKWGDTDKALSQRGLRADLRTKKLASDLAEQTQADKVAAAGLKNTKAQADIVDKTSQTKSRDDRLPGQLELTAAQVAAQTQKTAQDAELHPANVDQGRAKARLTELEGDSKDLSYEQQVEKAALQSQVNQIQSYNNSALLEFHRAKEDGMFEEKGSAQSWLANNLNTSGSPEIAQMLKTMNEGELNNLMTDAGTFKLELSKGLRSSSAGNFSAAQKVIDAEDGVIGNEKIVKNDDGSIMVVVKGEDGEFDMENPTIRGKDWGDFRSNVDAWADPVNAIGIALNKANVKKVTAQAKLYGVQADQHVLDKYKTEVTDFMGSQAYYAMQVNGEGQEALEQWGAEFFRKLKKDGSGLAGGSSQPGESTPKTAVDPKTGKTLKLINNQWVPTDA